MSSVWYQFVSPQQTGLCKSRSCDLCGVTFTRLKEAPTSETGRDGSDKHEFPRGCFDGWSHYSRTYVEGQLVAIGLDVGDPTPEYAEVHVDFCKGCTAIVWDSLIAKGVIGKVIDTVRNAQQTIYLDAFGQEVKSGVELEGRPMCVFRSEGKLGIKPCRRVHMHEGECSPIVEPGCTTCPACTRDQGTGEGSLLFTLRQLEHHAVTVHDCERLADGQWHYDRVDRFYRESSARSLLSAISQRGRYE